MRVLTVDYTTSTASRDLAQSFRETGFAVLTNHPIAPALMEDVFAEWANFFAGTDKVSYTNDPTDHGRGNAGFFPFRTENAKGYDVKDLKEFYHYYPWQGLPRGLTDKTTRLFRDLEVVASTMLGWLEDHVPDTIRSKFDRSMPRMVEGSALTLLRILHYPPLQDSREENAIRAHAHGDINLITLVAAATQPGLEVQDLDGTWHAVPCDANQIAINSGDMLQLLTEGFFPSTIHRVVNPSGDEALKSRYSMPLFLHPHEDVRLSADTTAGQFLHQRLVDIGIRKVA